MSQAKSVAQGFLATATAIWLFNCGWLIQLNAWIALGLFLALLIPFAIRGVKYLKSLSEKQPTQTRIKQAKKILLSLQGGAFACWFADVTSTIFVIDISQSGSELNPLGWPLGAVGALTFFVPATFAVYYLLFRMKGSAPFYGAIAITVVSIVVGSESFSAAQYNFVNMLRANWSWSVTWTSASLLIMGIWQSIYAILLILNLFFLRKDNQASKKNQLNV